MASAFDFLKVTIDFRQSHTFFPTIVGWVLVGLLVAIAVAHGPAVLRKLRGGYGDPRAFLAKADKRRLFGTLALTVLYFLGMDALSDVFPNTGYGFLIASSGFMFALSLLYARDLTRRGLAVIAATALLAPLVTWYVFEKFFNLTLP